MNKLSACKGEGGRGSMELGMGQQGDKNMFLTCPRHFVCAQEILGCCHKKAMKFGACSHFWWWGF